MNLRNSIKTPLVFVLLTLLGAGSALAQTPNYTQYNNAPSAGVSIVALLVELVICVVIVAGMWKMFAKAGQPGWAAIIPFYNAYILCKIVGRPGWWVIVLLIPFVNAIFGIILCLDLAKSFGKSIGFAVGLIFLTFIFIPILGFGDAAYQGPKTAT